MKKNWRLWAGAFFLALLAVIAVAGPHLPFVDTELKETGAIRTDEGKIILVPFPPMEGYPLGSTHKGVDILSLLIMGTGETLKIVLGVVALRYVFAVPLAVAGFYSRFIEWLMNGWQQLFSFMPPIFFVSFFSGLPFIFFSDWRPFYMILVIALLETGRVAEIIHTHLRDTEKRPYIEAGIVTGCTPFTLFRNYYMPVVIPNIIVMIINDIGRTLFLLAQLGIVFIFISQKFMMNEWGSAYEVVNTSPSWPMIFESILKDVRVYKWIPFAGIGAIGLTLLFINLFAGGVQRYFESRHRTARYDL